ncbi:FAR1-related protein [Trifolium medium]|uniref:FAR1-related protein n=1 Tax=Trifolium medium TaxID=97028 RepID=A0A392M3Z2_9FABA|nr:FAR1-related protein [Trifolium medium]
MVIMFDAKSSKEPKPKVDVKSNKQPKVDAKRIKESKVDAKPVKEQPKVDVMSIKEQPKVDTPKVDFRVHFTTERKFDSHAEMISWVRDEAYKLGFVVVIAKFDSGWNNRKPFVTLGCQRGSEYRKYINKEQ